MQKHSSRGRRITGSMLIAIGILLALLDIGLRLLDDSFSDLGSPAAFTPKQYEDAELAQLFGNYDAVFIGTVRGFNKARDTGLPRMLIIMNDAYRGTYTIRDWDYRLPAVVFAVERAWKGVRQSQVAMPVGFHDSDSYCWGRDFTTGKRYLVYAKSWSDGPNRPFSTSFCDPTTEFPYDYDAIRSYYDLPPGIPDLDLRVVGSGYVPSEQVILLRFDIPWVLVIAGVLVSLGVLLILWPKLRLRATI